MSKELRECIEDLNKLQQRATLISKEAETADEKRCTELNTELDSIEERKKELLLKKQELEEKENEERAAAEKIEDGKGTEVNLPTEERKMEKTITREMKEYRDAFYAFLQGNATPEQRAALITTENGVALPKELDDKIWDNIHTAHPILADIDIKNTGVILEVTKHTAITAGKAKKVTEGTANDNEANTFVKVVLNGNDYSKNVELSYAEAKMSQGALEDYLATEIAADLGEALSVDVFAQIKADCAANKVVAATLDYASYISAFGKVSAGSNLVVYASRATKYGSVLSLADKNGQPVFRDGVTFGSAVKEDSAAGNEIFILDPKMFVLNVVQPVMIETDKDIKAHKIIYSGYTRAQGTMRNAGAGAFIAKA